MREKLGLQGSITQYKINYAMKRYLRMTPEQRYQREKSHWYWHESSYSMRGLQAYDGKGCNGFTGCVSECKFYLNTEGLKMKRL
jgi:hypothetical protein